ncbi:hypothetical protein HDU86_005588 [Geranomyces michiganensis]|nr:hypothetical protein HDU86_005588 [Geranomyces michiganensis]
MFALIGLNLLFLALLPVLTRLVIKHVPSHHGLRTLALIGLAAVSVYQTPFLFPHEDFIVRCFFIGVPWLHTLRLVDLVRHPARATRLAVTKDAWTFAAWMNLSAEGTVFAQGELGTRATVRFARGVFKLLLLSFARSLRPLTPAEWADLYSTASVMNHQLLAAAFGIALYLWIGGLADSISALVEPVLCVRIPDVFDSPHLSTSLRDFWAKKWNRPFQDALKRTVMTMADDDDAGNNRRTSGKGKRGTPLQALAVFLVSGLFHDIINYRCLDECSLRTTMFFTLQFVGCAAEGYWEKRKGSGPPAHQKTRAVLRWAAVMAFLTATGPLFVEPFFKHGAMAVLPVPDVLDVAKWRLPALSGT